MSSSSIMNEIQALIAPPGEVQETKVGLNLHPYFKKPGRGHNSDKCHSCGESGDLLCCDQCPASFHLLCHDPPISVESLPEGTWICHRCKALEAIKLGASPIVLPKLESVEMEECADSKLVRSPLEYLLQAASMLNPKEFELPRELNPHEILPEDSKFFLDNNISGKKKNTDADRAPMALRLCHSCRKGTRVGVLISCDYCSAHFHLDCLDPPLSTPPLMSVWMCPLHVEHLIDSTLESSSRLTERVKLCNRFCGSVDQGAIKIDFLRKAASRRLKCRTKPHTSSVEYANIPESVKYFYEHPVQLPPSTIDPPIIDNTAPLSSREDRETWLKAVVKLQLATARHISVDSSIAHAGKQPASDSAVVSLSDKEGNAINGQSIFVKSTDGCVSSCLVSSQSPDQAESNERSSRNCSQTEPAADVNNSLEALISQLKSKQEFAGYPDLHPLSDELIKALAADRLTQFGDVELTRLTAPQYPLDNLLSVRSLVAARAVFIPLHGYGSCVEMQTRSFTIGVGAANTLNFSTHSFCNRVSAHHATVYYDDETDQFELLNYSQYGTIVDGVTFSNSLSSFNSANSAKCCEETVEKLVKTRACWTTRSRSSRKTDSPASRSATAETMSTGATMEARRCWCSPSDYGADHDNTSTSPGLEGAAPLQHGSLLRFGCIEFVFGVVEHSDVSSVHQQDILEALRKRAVAEDMSDDC